LDPEVPGAPSGYPALPNNFDLLRILLAYAVVVYHSCFLTGHEDLVPGSVAGVAVGGFFVISGFLLTWSLGRNPDLRAFTIKRFFRIYPLYALVIVAQAAALVVEAGARGGANVVEVARYLGANLVFANFLQPTIGSTLSSLKLDAINGSAWTLKVEIACYVALPAVLAVQRRVGAGATAALALGLGGYPLLAAALSRPAPGQVYLGLGCFFLVGSLLYHWGARLMRYDRAFLTLGAVGAPVLLIGSPVIMRWPIAAQVIVGCWVFAVAFARPKVTIHHDVSYGAYLLHFPLIQLALVHGLLPVGSAPLTVILVVAATTGLAWASFDRLERPMVHLGHGRARRRRAG
jgi:peptidoglycan/LPS O-acetylase OafA/YrhL